MARRSHCLFQQASTADNDALTAEAKRLYTSIVARLKTEDTNKPKELQQFFDSKGNCRRCTSKVRGFAVIYSVSDVISGSRGLGTVGVS